MMPNKQIVVVVGIIEREGRFLILQRIDDNPMWHHKWELPGGKIEPGETPLQAFRREMVEETGLQVLEPELLGIHTHHWNLPEYTQQTFLIVYRAQANLGDVVLASEENDAHRWVIIDEYLSMDNQLEANKLAVAKLYAPLFK